MNTSITEAIDDLQNEQEYDELREFVQYIVSALINDGEDVELTGSDNPDDGVIYVK